MEIKILEKAGNYLKLRINDEPHTLYNLLKEEIIKNDDVLMCGYSRDQTFEETIIFQIETREGTNPVEIILDAARRLKEINEQFRTAFENAYPE
ncbi:MAG: hypothetical protein D6732_06385 [Methanobacteriota archaeon]|nr:MAG: hypothetical protein D6732_06385 [Euryarchaeota archaeon]